MAGGMCKAKQRRAAKTKRNHGYESKGERPSVAKKTLKAMRTPTTKTAAEKALNKLDAWEKGKRVVVGKDENGKPLLASKMWGDAREKRFKMTSKGA